MARNARPLDFHGMTHMETTLAKCSHAAIRLLSTTPARLAGVFIAFALLAMPVMAAEAAGGHKPGGEANLVLPDVGKVSFLNGAINGHNLLMIGLLVSALGMGFGLMIYAQLKNMPVHKSMLDISELIYATCKSYMIQQGKFLMVLWIFIAAIVGVYFGKLVPTLGETGAVVYGMPLSKVAIILAFSLVGIAGSYGVAWFGIRVNTFANSRAAFASLRGKPFPCYAIPLKAGMSIGMALISVELLIMLGILLFVPGNISGACLIGFAIGESLGASALRIAGGIFTKIADIGSDLMKIVFKIKEDDARNPGVIADCVGDNAGDSVGPSADGFETYGVTGVALITFIMLAINEKTAGAEFASVQIQLLVWLFAMRILMVIASAVSYFINEAMAKAKYGNASKFNSRPKTSPRLHHLDRVGHPHVRRVLPAHPHHPRRWNALVEALGDHHLRHRRGRDHPRTREGLYLHPLKPLRLRGRRGLRAGRRRSTSFRPGRGQLLRVLARPRIVL